MQGIALDSGDSTVNKVNILDLMELKSVWMEMTGSMQMSKL